MLEKMKAVSNPLTIIALFAALAEVAGTVSLKFLDPSLQKIFIWFVMGFPTLIVVAFFLVLIFKREVLYGPGDFREDKSFLDLSSNAKQVLDLEKIEKMLVDTKEGLNEAVRKVEIIGAEQKMELIAIINNKIQPVQNVVEVAKENVEVLGEFHQVKHARLSATERKIMTVLSKAAKPVPTTSIWEYVDTSPGLGILFLSDLLNNGYVASQKDGDEMKFSLTRRGQNFIDMHGL